MRLLLDTNAIISLLKNEGNLIEIVSKASAVNISNISQLEFLSFPEISANDVSLFRKFISRVNVIDLNHSDIKLLQKITTIRKDYRFKLPDAIIVASAIYSNSLLVSRDKELVKIDELKLINW